MPRRNHFWNHCKAGRLHARGQLADHQRRQSHCAGDGMLNPATTSARPVKSELETPVLGVIEDSEDVATVRLHIVTAPRHRGKALGRMAAGRMRIFGNRNGGDRAWSRWLNQGCPARPR